MKAGVFIVDDHYIVIEGIRSLLQHEAMVDWMGHATNAGSCLNFLKLNHPDVILMDISLPDQSGIELCKMVKQLYPGICILGLSTFNQQAIIEDMVRSGASGYVLKNATREELMAAITAVLKGGSYYSLDVTRTLRDAKQRQPVITRREKEVLQLIADGLTNNEISEKLFISIPTVNTHRKSLLEKFDAKNTAILISKAIKQGMV